MSKPQDLPAGPAPSRVRHGLRGATRSAASKAAKGAAIIAAIIVAAPLCVSLQFFVAGQAWRLYQRHELSEREARVMPVRRMAAWSGAMARPLQERLGPAPEALVELMRVDTEIEGLAERAYVPAIDAVLLRDLRLAIAGLPYEVRRAVDGKLAGVYLMSGFAGSGMAQQLFDEQGRVVGGVIVLDPLQFKTRTANTWMQWKESQPFYDDRSGWRLRAEIAEAGDDDRVRAIQWTLLHEIGHVLAYGTDLLPPYGLAARSDPGDAAADADRSGHDGRRMGRRGEVGKPCREKPCRERREEGPKKA